MVDNTQRHQLAEEDVIRIVKWGFRICNYLFNLGAGWIFVGAVGIVLSNRLAANDDSLGGVAFGIQAMGLAIFSAAVEITLAIYRCPVCDKYLSRFRPQKEFCPSCGVRVQASKSK
jgi:hypothetical protein